MKLSDTITRKFVESFNTSEWEVESHDRWKDIISSNKTIKYQVYEVTLESGKTIRCADDHIFIDNNFNEVFAKDSLNLYLFTKYGKDLVINVTNLHYEDYMYDLSVDGDHLYYTDDVLSHNTISSATYLLWRSIFHNTQINIGIVANKPKTAREVLDKIKKIFLESPIWLVPGIEVWNKSEIEYENGTRIMTDSPSSDSFRGYTCNIIYTDESAYIKKKLWDDFLDAVIPTMNSLIFKQVINTSTSNGMNHFYSMVEAAKNNNSEIEEIILNKNEEIKIGGDGLSFKIEDLYIQIEKINQRRNIQKQIQWENSHV